MTEEVRPFDLRHLMMVGRLQSQGTALDLEQALTRPRAALWPALLGHWSLAEGPVCTFVLPSSKDAPAIQGFAQARLRPGGDQADVIFIAPSLDNHRAGEEIWSALLNGVVNSLAAHGVRWIFARLSDELDAAHVFLDAGFTLYTREDIFALDHVRGDVSEHGLLQMAGEDDEWGVAKLCANATPKLVRTIEGIGNRTGTYGPYHPLGAENEYVWRNGGRVSAHARVASGPHGHWITVMVHPEDYGYAKEVIEDVLARLPKNDERPVYCGLRAYQGHFRGPLQDLGFRFLTSQSVLVRINVVPICAKEVRQAAILEKRAEAHTPTSAPTNAKCA